MLQSLALFFVAGFPMAAVFLLPKAITADVADYDELVSGERREALFYSTQNFFEKVTFALPPLFLSLTLLLGDTPDNPWVSDWSRCSPVYWPCPDLYCGPGTSCRIPSTARP